VVEYRGIQGAWDPLEGKPCPLPSPARFEDFSRLYAVGIPEALWPVPS